MTLIYYMYFVILIIFIIILFVIIRSVFLKYKEQEILNKVSKKISDGYLIFTVSGKITNYNKSIINAFQLNKKDLKNKSVSDIFNVNSFSESDIQKVLDACKKVKNTNEPIKFDIKSIKNNKVFSIEIKSIVNNDIFLRYVLICKDVTNAYEMIEELQKNQDMMANREKFATLGQLISGIIHSLKSPIFALSGELDGLNNLIQEYSDSVGDETVTIQDHYDIAKDMNSVLDKMKEQVENISDSITAVRSQVVTLNNEDDKKSFTINELVKYIDVLTKNTLKEDLIMLQFTVKVPKDFEIKGNLNSLVQAINNLIMNSIDSYKGKANQLIEIIIEKKNGKLAISVVDTGCGIPKKIQNKIFKEIITKDNSDKVGLGLFMTYSNIKAAFNGDMEFKSQLNKGSTFTILLPL